MKKPIQDRKVTREVYDTVAAASGLPSTAPALEIEPVPVSFADDIRPIFQQFRGPMMWRFDLTDYNAVLGNAQLIYDMISQKKMPPPPFPPLTESQIQAFKNWMHQGCPE